jgi:hypothetical protein
MRFFLYTILFNLLLCSKGLANGENCTSPIPVSVGCPRVTLTGQSTAGMGNDINGWRYSSSLSTTALNGEDILYELTLPSGITDLIISMTSVNKYCNVYTSTSCAINSTTLYPAYYMSMGNNNNISLALPSSGNTLYLYIDHSGSSALTFDIAFGAVTKGTFINIPDKRGTLEFVKNNCVNPSFLSPLDLYKDGVKLTAPGSFGPNNQSHEFCFKLFIQNLTGIEGVKSVKFTFRSAGFTGVSVPVTSQYGKYSSGTWNATVSSNVVLWTYTNFSDPYKGDYDDVTKNCMEYNFCMNATPGNNVAQQIIDIWVTGDAKTPGYSGYQYTGCCATDNCNLYGAGGYKGLAGTAFGGPGAAGAGFGMGVGNSGLPVDLLDIWTENFTTLCWKTIHETKLSYYSVQYSKDGKEFENIQQISAAANDQSGTYLYRSMLDDSLMNGYLRLKCVDEDGTEKFSRIIPYTLPLSHTLEILALPNPVKDILHLSSTEEIRSVHIYNINGNYIYSRSTGTEDHLKEMNIDLEQEPKGIYTISVITDEGILHKQIVKD